MINEDFLIEDEKAAISGYNEYLNQSVRNPSIIPLIKSIIRDEEKHIKILKKVKKIKIK
jgi:rubrerythrin